MYEHNYTTHIKRQERYIQIKYVSVSKLHVVDSPVCTGVGLTGCHIKYAMSKTSAYTILHVVICVERCFRKHSNMEIVPSQLTVTYIDVVEL